MVSAEKMTIEPKEMMGGSSEIGWDDSALDQEAQKPTTDANDYSRFNDIGKEEEAEEKAEALKKENELKKMADLPSCRNCSKIGAKLKCSICKKACYCHQTCQRDDWKFHRRICKKPEEKKKKPPSKNSTSPPAAASAPASATEKKQSKPKPTKKEQPLKVEEPDLKDAKGYKNGLPYFHRQQTEEEKELIGCIKPKKIEPAVVNTSSSTDHDGSAWNSAGTFEERNYTSWATKQFEEMLDGVEVSVDNVVFKTTKVSNITGDASICVVRRKKRFLFDMAFNVAWEVDISENKYEGKLLFSEISSDGDYEISYNWKRAPKGDDLAIVKSGIAHRESGLQKELLKKIEQFVELYQQQ